ncbi:fructosamine kinase family protein [Kribbella sp.]|uniref:fructosamine kinase family protein n=1 Tax=Kribbella sp. TaxID=1871183 RepID=UPI002D42528B|nr:fructosamine kinase family protein [Kribbella sp.]HZX08648.1 fructosamine kinase family protein [Kribbella sp.]
MTFVKSRPDAPADFFQVEAAGLRWLAVPGGVPVAAPAGWNGDGYIGTLPLPHAVDPPPSWGAFYANLRLRPYLQEWEELERVCQRLESGVYDDPAEEPARIHGDLWSGNVVWTPDGVHLIDPAAHGGHRETDLAMLALFGLPHLERVLRAYDEVRPLADGWRERVGLHQLHPLVVHAVLFGGGYIGQAIEVSRRY